MVQLQNVCSVKIKNKNMACHKLLYGISLQHIKSAYTIYSKLILNRFYVLKGKFIFEAESFTKNFKI